MQKLSLSDNQLEAPAADSRQVSSAGLDIGNGATKLIVSGLESRIPSYIQPLQTPLIDPPAAGYVEYLSGDRGDLGRSNWLAGDAAYQSNPEAFHRVVDDVQGKTGYGLQLLLGALSYLPQRPVWDLQAVASIHHAAEMGAQLSNRLSGRHEVRFNGHEQASLVTVRVLKVLDEGAGAIIAAGLTRGQTLVYDLGYGTIITSVFGERGKPLPGARSVSVGGVSALVDAIAKNSALIQRLGHEGDREVIRRAIENHSFRYGLVNGFDFEHVYRDELKPWITTVLKSAIKAGAKWAPTSTAAIAIGGGSQLPIVSELLQQQGIKPLSRGAWSNASGLHTAAVMLGEK